MHEQMDRLYKAAKELRGIEGQSGVARLLNKSPQNINNWESRGISSIGILESADIIGCSASWLRTGDGPMVAFSSEETPITKSGEYLIDDRSENKHLRCCEPTNIYPGPELRGKVPLISWVQAGAFCEVIDNLHPGDADEWIDTSVQVRAHTFALRVQGDSMEPTFPSGIIVVVEPDMEPLPGDYVIAKNGDEEATFKQLVKDGADWYLKPLNPRYPIKPLAGSKIVGVVRSAEQRFR